MAERSNLPTIRESLSRVHRLLILFSVLLSGTMLLTIGAFTIRDYAQRNLVLTARTIGYTVEPALVFGDAEAVRQGVESIARGDDVDRAQVWDSRGHLLVDWSGPQPALRILRLIKPMIRLEPVTESVRRNGQVLGSIRITGGGSILRKYVLVGAMISLFCLTIAVFATSLLARRLQKLVVAPLDRVVAVAHAVRTERKFDRRVPRSGLAEIDRLTGDFNELLAELQGWHASLTLERDEFEHRATHDVLTGLGNRALFNGRVMARMADRGSLGIFYLDIDGFKEVNDQHGHIVGDLLLGEVARRLGECVRRGDEAFRIGGDEFVLLIGSLVGRSQMAVVRDRIEAEMARPMELPDGRTLAVSLSMGSALFPEDGKDLETLLRVADAAMYRHKKGKRALPDTKRITHA